MSYIRISQTANPYSAKTKRWVVKTAEGDHLLGDVLWLTRWRKYAFNPVVGTVFEEVCLREIATFVEEQTREHRKNRAEKR